MVRRSGITVHGVEQLDREIQGIIEAYCQNVAYRMFNDAYYAGYVENGTWKTRAQPFMRPGMEAAARNMGNDIRNAGSTEEAVKGIVTTAAEEAFIRCPVDTGYLRSRIQVEKVA